MGKEVAHIGIFFELELLAKAQDCAIQLIILTYILVSVFDLLSKLLFEIVNPFRACEW